jgi:hypothetical protein
MSESPFKNFVRRNRIAATTVEFPEHAQGVSASTKSTQFFRSSTGPRPSLDPHGRFHDSAHVCETARMQARIGGATVGVSRIRILLVGVAGMLNEIIRATISSEPDMTIVDGAFGSDDDIGAYTRQRHIDVVIYPAGNEDFAEHKIIGMLHANPRLSLLSIDGQRDQGTLHHLVPARDAIGRLVQSSLTDAIRAGAALKAR